VKVLNLLILSYMIVLMTMAVHFKADQDSPLPLLVPIVVAFYSWMAVVCREKWLFLPLALSIGFEVLMGGARLMYVDVITHTSRGHDINDPSMRMVADFYPGFVADVNEHPHYGGWFRTRELFLFFFYATVLFFAVAEIELINRDRQVSTIRNQLDHIAVIENADAVGPEHPSAPPPSYE
ncbi:hypothetical protein PFISCL1PPCAC_17206, partial [Pristionchus fissidentatus]